MPEEPHAYLEEFGLSAAEVEAYMALIRNGPLGASAIASVTRLRRSNVYHALDSLTEKGLVEGASGYGSRFSAVPAKQALPSLIAREKEALAERERLAGKIVEQLSSLEEQVEPAPDEVIQVIRSPRAAGERFDRLQLEAERKVDLFTKPPFFQRTGNPTQEKAQRRGVRYRSLYEKSALENPAVTQFFCAGEEARIYDGELPHKLAIFDSEVVLVPLIRPGEQIKTLLIRHTQLAQSLSLAFEYLWERSKAPVEEPQNKGRLPKPKRRKSGMRNGAGSSSTTSG